MLKPKSVNYILNNTWKGVTLIVCGKHVHELDVDCIIRCHVDTLTVKCEHLWNIFLYFMISV